MKKDKLHLNPFYKYLLYRDIKKDLKIGNTINSHSLSTYEVDMHLHKRPLFSRLVKQIKQIAERIEPGTVYMESMWMNVNKKGGKVNKHHHLYEGFISHANAYRLGEMKYRRSGVYYLSKPKNSGNFVIYNPEREVVKVETNDIIIFGAEIEHETEISQTDKKRIVCGFNMAHIPP